MINLILPFPNIEFRPELASVIELLQEKPRTFAELCTLLGRSRGIVYNRIEILRQRQIILQSPPEIHTLNTVA
jgi:predicted transcriptional regulator